MESCLSVSFRRVGGFAPSFSREDAAFVCTWERMPDENAGAFDKSFDASFDITKTPRLFTFRRIEDFSASFQRVDTGFRCWLGLVCNNGVRPVVKVEKEYLWLTPDNLFTADNYVIANVEWNIT